MNHTTQLCGSCCVVHIVHNFTQLYTTDLQLTLEQHKTVDVNFDHIVIRDLDLLLFV